MRAKLVLSGSFGAIHGAQSATMMMAMPTTPPTTDSGFRRAKPRSSRAIEPSDDAIATELGDSVGAVMRDRSVTDAGIDEGVGHVDEHVDHHEDGGVEQ